MNKHFIKKQYSCVCSFLLIMADIYITTSSSVFCNGLRDWHWE